MFHTQGVRAPECGITLGWHAAVSPGEVSASDRTNENKRREAERKTETVREETERRKERKSEGVCCACALTHSGRGD